MKALHNKSEMASLLAAAHGKLVVVDFHAEWCGPCKKIAPALARMQKEFPHVCFASVDVDEAPDIQEAYMVTAMPTFLLIEGGTRKGLVLSTVRGAMEDTLRSQIKSCAKAIGERDAPSAPSVSSPPYQLPPERPWAR